MSKKLLLNILQNTYGLNVRYLFSEYNYTMVEYLYKNTVYNGACYNKKICIKIKKKSFLLTHLT